MADDDSAEDKTELPTQKRLDDARERGQVARSRELGTAAVMIVGSASVMFSGGSFASAFSAALRNGLTLSRDTVLDPYAMGHALGAATVSSLVMLLPFFGAVMGASLLAPLALGGWVFTPDVFVPKFERLDPLKGLGRIFGLSGLSELVKALLKFAVVGSIAVWVGMRLAREAMALGAMPIEPGMGRAAHLWAQALLSMSLGLIVIAAVDAPFQWWFTRRQMKMTRDEVKQEYKETDGRPEVKARIREMQRKMSRRRMMDAVPTADVIVTNPTHYAVALKYDSASMRAPRVLAKGRDLTAVEIRRRATEAGVPLFEAPALARVLHGSTEVGREIPSGLYLAVAQVLSYVYQVKTLTPWRAAKVRRPTPEVDAELRAKYDRGGDAE